MPTPRRRSCLDDPFLEWQDPITRGRHSSHCVSAAVFFLPRCRLWQDVAAAAQAQALLERDPAAQPELPVGAAPSQVLVEAGATGMNRGATP
jgi:hypothetical protein